MAFPVGQDSGRSAEPARVPIANAARHGASSDPIKALDLGTMAVSDLASFFELSPDAIVAVRPGGRVAFVNNAARAMFAIWSDPTTLVVDDLLPSSLRHSHAVAREDYEQRPRRREMAALSNLVAQRLDGSLLSVEVSLAPISTSEGILTIAAVRDVSERRHQEKDARRTQRLHAVLAQASDAMLEATTSAELYRRICESAAWTGSFVLAWVGLLDGSRIVPVAAAGLASSRLFHDLDLDDDGPVPSAIRQQQPVAHEIPREGSVPAWAEPFQRARVRSLCALPLACGAAPVGALGLWSHEAGFFSEERLALCEQLALFVSHALERLKSLEIHEEVARLGRLALASNRIDDLFGEIATSVVRTLQALSCTIDEQLFDGSLLRRAQAGSEHDASTPKRRFSLGSNTCAGRLEIVPASMAKFTAAEQGYLDAVVNILSSTLERRRVEQRLSHLALHDPLTGMPNRLMLLERLSEALAQAGQSGSPIAVLFIDLDRFKLVNDALGHSWGDRLLLEVANRLGECVGCDTTIARIGGDEFALVCQATAAARLAQRIVCSLETPFTIATGSSFVSASIGIALSRPGVSVEELLREADAAMYAAKRRNERVAFFDEELRVQALQCLKVEADLRDALRKGELAVYYQPVYALDGTVCALEALVRWRHPSNGFVSPVTFIPLAEDTGLIWELGAPVVEIVCAQLDAWRAVPLLGDLPIAINVSGVQLANAGLPALIQAALAHYRLPTSCLQVEITETALLRDAEGARRVLLTMREAGVQTAIDDFGAGNTSLHYLRHLPVDVIKIDRSFVNEIDSNDADLAIVRSVVELARALRLRTVAEGVERASQLDVLRAIGCDLAQGFLWAPALPAEEIVARLTPTPACQPA
jgi:diguanylate cyclase (GGDEF)-like protein/PAS domain S-box-containing protein